MSFQIHALPAETFAPLFRLSDEALADRHAVRVQATGKPGFPCRVSLEDAEIGEQLLLLNYEHLAEPTPFRSRHAIYVRAGAAQARPKAGVLPDLLLKRLIALRGFDSSHRMVAAEVAPGETLGNALAAMLGDRRVDYVHLHSAAPGCYLAKAIRA